MWSQLLFMILRRILLVILANTAINEFLGPDVVEYLLGDSFIGGLVAAILSGGLLLYSVRDKILEKLRLKEAISAPPRTTVAEVKAAVAEKPVAEKLSEAFTPEGRV